MCQRHLMRSRARPRLRIKWHCRRRLSHTRYDSVARYVGGAQQRGSSNVSALGAEPAPLPASPEGCLSATTSNDGIRLAWCQRWSPTWTPRAAPEHVPAACRGRSPARTGPAVRPCATSWAAVTRPRTLLHSCGESVANRLRIAHQTVRGVYRRRSSSRDSGAGRDNQKSHLPPPQVCRDLCWIDLLLARSSPFWGSLGASISWENSGARNSAPGSQVHFSALGQGLRHC